METLDLSGKVCPYPIISVSNKLREMKKKGIKRIELEVIVTDCDALKSIPEIAKKIGAKVEEVKKEDGSWRLIIRMG